MLLIAVVCRVGLEVPRVEVRFRNLRVSTEVNVGRRALPTLPNYVRDITEVRVLYIFADRFVQFLRISTSLTDGCEMATPYETWHLRV